MHRAKTEDPDKAPMGWPPMERPALVIVVGRRVTWAVVSLSAAAVVLLAALVWAALRAENRADRERRVEALDEGEK